MKNNTLLIVLVTIILMLTSCAGTPPRKTYFLNTKDFNAEFGDVWEGVIESFAETMTPIKTLEKQSGIIVAEMMGIPFDRRTQYSQYCDCGTTSALYRFEGLTGNFNVFVKRNRDSGKVSVTINSKFITQLWGNCEATRGYHGPVRCESRGLIESEVLSKISSHIKLDN